MYYFEKLPSELTTGCDLFAWRNIFIKGKAKQMLTGYHDDEGDMKKEITETEKEKLINIIEAKIKKINPATVTNTYTEWLEKK